MTDIKKVSEKYRFDKIDIATGRLNEMVTFYSELFGIDFEEIVFQINNKEWKRYLGKIGEITFHLVPNETSNTVKDQDGVHQFHIKVQEIENFKTLSKENGFDLIPCDFGEGKLQYLIRDPDGHPWILS